MAWLGSLHGRLELRVRYTTYWWALPLQVLPRTRGQGARDETEAFIRQGTPRKARLVAKREFFMTRDQLFLD